MKTTALLAILALASCGPIDPVTGIRQNAPPEWAGTPNPLDTPDTTISRPPSEGNFGHEWLWR